MYAAGLPKNACDEASSAAESQGALAGAFQPVPPDLHSNVTFAS
jgi:hypothetical protein